MPRPKAYIKDEQRRTVLESLKQHGTYRKAAIDAGCTVQEIWKERKRSKMFDDNCQASLIMGRSNVGDNALTIVESIAYDPDKDNKTRLTAALALCNAFVPGFKGVQKTESKVEHELKVITGIPRPVYEIIEPDKLEAGK